MTKDIEGFYGIKAWVVRKHLEITSEGKYKNYSMQPPNGSQKSIVSSLKSFAFHTKDT